MKAAEQLHPMLTAEAADAAFAAYLAERPQVQLDTAARPVPGWCDCPRYRIGDKPIFHKHRAGCDSTSEPAEAFTYVGTDRLMHRTTLPALAAWIPAPPAPPAVNAAVNETVIRRMVALGFHLVKLRAGAKHPVGAGWNDPAVTPALTAEEAIEHVANGGGLGVLLGPSRLIVVDAENAAATVALKAAGLRPVLRTAKGMSPVSADPRVDKRGGSHIWCQYGEDFDTSRLQNLNQRKIGDGGLVDVLAAPGSMAVVPPTALIEAAGWWYTADGNHTVWSGEPLDAPPDWLLDAAVECPAGLESIHGGLTPVVRGARGAEQTEASAELSSEIDAVPWSAIMELDPRIEDWGDRDPSCGDIEIHWNGADHRRSAWMHECERGNYVHIVSGTMLAALGIDGKEATLSKLQLACRLRGVETTGAGFRSTAEHFGIAMPSKFGDFADTMDEAAERYEDRADDPEQCTGTAVEPDPDAEPEFVCLNPLTRRVNAWRKVTADRDYWLRQASQCRRVAAHLRSRAQATPQGGETYLTEPVIGAVPPQPIQQPAEVVPPAATATEAPGVIVDAETVEVPGQAEPASGTELDPDDAIEGELVGGVDTVELEKEIRDLRGKIVEIEDRMLALGVPAVQRIWDLAESEGVYPHGLACAILPRAVSGIPPNVLLPARNRSTEEKVMGQGVNIYAVNVAVSSAGKGETENAADAAIPLRQGVKRLGLGTAEYYAKELRGVDDGKTVIHTTSILNVIDEMDQLNAYLSQPGNKLPGFLTMAYQNGQGGQGTSNKDNSAVLPKHGSRIGFQVNSQPEKMAILAQHNAIGAVARFIVGNTGLIHPDDVGPLYGLTVAPVMADQSSQPWHHTGHVADPPIPCQQPQSARAAAGAVPDITNIGNHRTEEGEERKGHVGFDDAPPIWVTLPDRAAAALRESHCLSAELAADPTMALRAEVSAHRVVTILHASVGFAVLDGGYSPTDEQWEAAELLVEGSDLVKAMCRAYIELEAQSSAFKASKVKGAGNAGSKAAEAAITTSGIHSAKNAILNRLLRAGGSAKPTQIRKGVTAKQLAEKDKAADGVTGAFGGLSKGQKAFMHPAFNVLEREGKVHLAADGRWVLGPDTKQIAA
ncbi:bifunctional DNA primase/polymerase [Tsukamurella pseudospumae]|uniref:DNA primase/polymerase bifunctional N-terminal domain-containing protein n=1 Tax=Tsukamurella pseudospumae TaxID=239498 RepID=A0A138AE25_9ACTN|nr:bifunctional DNA primase/polymerase [Tsukamurella pseudospumae]KXP08703.1 hypothetical protein AXK60_08495 [Tsukamurella pseudospumae]